MDIRILFSAMVLTILSTTFPARADGLYSWGFNGAGELGDGTTTNRTSPVKINTLTSGVSLLSTGSGQTASLAIVSGSLEAWGSNSSGQIGDGTKTDRHLPVAIGSLTSGITAVGTGYYHSMAVKNGALYTWGDNSFGQLGIGSNTNSTVPVAVPTLATKVTAVVGGHFFSLAIQNGGVYAWGDNGQREVLDGTTTSRSSPVAIPALSTGVTAIAAGELSALALDGGAVYSWGSDSDGQLGNGVPGGTSPATTPYAIPSLSSDVTSIAAGGAFSLAVKNGLVYSWGQNDSGELGNGSLFTDSGKPTLVPGPTSIIQVAASGDSSYALSSDGSLWVWGRNNFGQLGLGDTTDRSAAVQLEPPAGLRFTGIYTQYGAAEATVASVPEPTGAFAVVMLTAAALGRWGRTSKVGQKS
jgi:alpha-tubulin suppressor-like RCC1 family protein